MRAPSVGWAAALTIVALPISGASAAQGTVTFLPGGSLPRLLAAPREPAVHAKTVLELEGPTRFGQIVSGDVALGDRLAVVRYGDSSAGPTVALGVEGAVFGRFNLETKERDLIATDWVFGVPLVVRGPRYWLRLRYHHISSHLGDEYIERFQVSRAHYNRDALDWTAHYLVVPGLGVYAGARYGIRVEPRSSGRFTVRGGLELDRSIHDGGVHPSLAVDVRFDAWEGRPAVNVQGGIRLRAENRHPDVRLILEIFAGPAPLGQFATLDATWIALGIALAR